MEGKLILLDKAKNLHSAGKIDQAIKVYKKIIDNIKDNPQVYYLIGTAYLQKKAYENASSYLFKAIKLKNDSEYYYNNVGIALSQMNNNIQAIENYRKALKLNPNFLDSIINLGIAYKKIMKYEESIRCFNRALKLSPNNFKIYNNIGNLFRDLGKVDDSIKSYNKSISLNEKNVEAYNNKAEIFLSKKRFVEAIKTFKKALEVEPKFPYLFGKYMHSKMHICDWNNFKKNLKKIEEGIINKDKLIEPFPMLSLIDNLSLQKKNSIIYNDIAFKKDRSYTKKDFKKNNNKIKIGYFGAEFYNHPVLQLTRDIFKHHDKSKFEIYGFFHGPVKDKLHYEVKKYFNNFFDIKSKSDDEVVILSKKIGINIAINFTGYTSDSRNEIYLKRVAPIQISYLGFSGTMGTDFMDYIIADNFLIPKNYIKYYSEKVLNLPGTFFPNPANIEISEKKFTKESVGIPKESFVFGSFNNSYKITPSIFETWMKILKNSENTVLWLLNNNEIASNNLIAEAKKYGVNSERIIFADKLIYSEHLRRFELMDLFLDTFPYNGHTTVIEAIRRGVPTLTLAGESFASRVAGSILNAIGLNKLVTKNLSDYIKTALDLAHDKEKFIKIKKNLNTENLIIFNSKRYTKNLENIYEDLVVKHS